MLRLENVVKTFGGVVATDHVSLDFPDGSLSAVIGPNGAGKTTLFNLITGHLVPDSGRILLGDEDIAGMPPARIVRKGVGRAFQVASIFPTMTVEQALMAAVASHVHMSENLLSAFPPPSVRQRAEELVELLGMGPEERWQMIRTVRRLWEQGRMTLVFIEHDMDIVFEVAQTISVLRYGAVLAQGTADEIRNNPEVIEAYLGTENYEEEPA